MYVWFYSSSCFLCVFVFLLCSRLLPDANCGGHGITDLLSWSQPISIMQSAYPWQYEIPVWVPDCFLWLYSLAPPESFMHSVIPVSLTPFDLLLATQHLHLDLSSCLQTHCRLQLPCHDNFRLRGTFGHQGSIKSISEAAKKASHWVWIKRGDVWRSALPGHKPDHPRLGRPGEGV